MASMSSRWIENAGRLAALLATSYVLLATSAPFTPPQICRHQAESLTFAVTGTCGGAGTITVTSPADDCAVTVMGASALGLPSAGCFDHYNGEQQVSLLSRPWTLSGYLLSPADAGADREAAVPADGAPMDATTDATDDGTDDATADATDDASTDATADTTADADATADGRPGDGGLVNPDGAIYLPLAPSDTAENFIVRRCPASFRNGAPNALTCTDQSGGRTIASCVAELQQR